jgi:hypothetical protein
VAICKTCGTKYSKWTTPVSAGGNCSACFEAELSKEHNASSQESVLAAPLAPVTEEEKSVVPIRLSSFIPRSRSRIVFALVMGCYSVTLGEFVSGWARVAHVRSPPRGFYLRGDASDVFAMLLVGPILESLILVGVFELVRRARAPVVVQVFVAALFISELHVWPWWPHAVIVLPSFCIQTASYLYWRRRGPWKDAFWVLVSIHALNNVVPALYAFAAHGTRHA